ncbi:hypothetical protein ACHHYP_10653 [Achlya hypogyna]|uniref:Uncharacterized protein n=1 Tax=Achlya hypogyna TaxID=1202772 RepID=A0A1V9YKT8_ACHHY|nr:hypothetical protein ACHHYP_10653 [Achlya hypogyna]
MASEIKRLVQDERAQAFLRSFATERTRWPELVEATFLYGIHCLSQNYSLHALTVEQVRDITRATLKKPLHYAATPLRNGREAAPKRAMATKPSSSWRRGTPDTEPESDIPSTPEVPTNAPVSESRREIEAYGALLGKPWLDAAWEAFVTTTGYPSIEVDPTDEALRAAYDRLRLPAANLAAPRTFLDFIRGSIVHAMAAPPPPEPAPDVPSSPKPKAAPQTPSPVTGSQPQPRRLPKPATQVPSKVKRELEAQKANILRVRKTTTQRMHEALAKHRVEQYEARAAKPATRPARPSKPQSVGELRRLKQHRLTSAGANALEIATMLADSPFMKNVTTWVLAAGYWSHRAIDYKGWLGDYGPAHTRTVVPGDWSELEDADTLWLQQRRGSKKGDLPPYEWNLDVIDHEEPKRRPSSPPPVPLRATQPEVSTATGDVDPAFEWLVHEARIEGNTFAR